MQFILLLGLFVKPLLVHVEGAQSGGALYRRVVVRNVICTVGIIASYAISTLIVILALLSESSESDKVRIQREFVTERVGNDRLSVALSRGRKPRQAITCPVCSG